MCIYNKSILDVCAGSPKLSLVASTISTSSANISSLNMYSCLMGLHEYIYNKSILDVRADLFELSLVACAISTSSTDISTFYVYRFPDSV